MDFLELKKTNCTKWIEKKGKFSYLSWPYMVDQLRTHLPKATIAARKNEAGMPYFADSSGALVETFIMNENVELWSEWLPVMDFKNKSITNPNSMDINKAIQRCKAKCISEYLGIGLYIYMGEDLPEQSDGAGQPQTQNKPPQQAKEPTFLSQMKWFATHENKIYKKILAFWQVDSATSITNEDSQVKIIEEIEAAIKN